jgi:hypothetical protein
VETSPSPFTVRAVALGAGVALAIAGGAPYANMVIRGSYMALDFSTPGAICLLFFLGGVVNVALRFAGPNWALSQGELIVVYIMGIVASAIATMGFSEYLVTIISGASYYATMENNWGELILPFIPEWLAPRDARAIRWFYEGVPNLVGIPFGAWMRPLLSWSIFAAGLYGMMIATAVILRRQWVQHERLAYPLVQVPLALTQPPTGVSIVPPFFRNPLMWAGFAVPLCVSSLSALRSYHYQIPAPELVSTVSMFDHALNLVFRLSFPMVGFSYLINLDIAFSLWFFNLFSNGISAILISLGTGRIENLGIYGVANQLLLAHQDMGAMAVLVLVGLWFSRRHLAAVVGAALKGGRQDDADEIMSYRSAVLIWCCGFALTTLWLWFSGLPLWMALAVNLLAQAIFVGLTRIVVEGGVAAAVAPMIASSAVVSAVGSSQVSHSGMVALAFTYVWSADIRTFVLASCAHGLKLSSHLGRNLRPLLWIIILALLLGLVGSIFVILHEAYAHGGINLNSWFFAGGTRAPFIYITSQLSQSGGPNWAGWLHTGLGAVVMLALMRLNHNVSWWPLHPLGYPIGAVWLMDQLWFSIFVAWSIKLVVLKYGGPRIFRATRPFSLGLIAGQFAAAGTWLAIDFCTGMTDNVVYWI